MRFQIEPPDSLIVQVAEIEPPVGSDDETVGIVDFPIGITGRASSDQRGHSRHCRLRSARAQNNDHRPERFAPVHLRPPHFDVSILGNITEFGRGFCGWLRTVEEITVAQPLQRCPTTGEKIA
jgi:hypothetical protein